jgi:hypothetical protein
MLALPQTGVLDQLDFNGLNVPGSDEAGHH